MSGEAAVQDWLIAGGGLTTRSADHGAELQELRW